MEADIQKLANEFIPNHRCYCKNYRYKNRNQTKADAFKRDTWGFYQRQPFEKDFPDLSRVFPLSIQSHEF